MVRNVLDTTGPSGNLQHVGLVTVLKHYLGPFEAYGTGATRDTPFHENEPRLDAPQLLLRRGRRAVAGRRALPVRVGVSTARTP